MTPIVHNRDFQLSDDGWSMIEPFGDHPNARAGIIQRIDGKAADSIVTTFNQQADKPNFPGMLVDHEHFKFDDSKESVAYGWLMRLKKGSRGIYGLIRWTSTGQAAVDGGDYRFFSTEYDPSDCEVVEDGDPKIVRPLRLDGLTLTNAPNNQGGEPITNRTPNPMSSTTDNSTLESILAEGRIRNRKKAAARFFESVEKVVQSSRCSPATAITVVKNREPELYAAMMAPDPSQPAVTNRASDAPDMTFDQPAAVKAFSNLVNAICRSHGKVFKDAWDTAKKEHPELYAAMGLESADDLQLPAQDNQRTNVHGEREPIRTKEETAQIANRAGQLQRQDKITPHAAFRRAMAEDTAARQSPEAAAIMNRAKEIMVEMPGTPFASAVIMAENQAKGGTITDYSIRNRRRP